MLARIFIFLIGFILTIIGVIHIICYLNLLTVGYSFKDYVNYIITHIECLYTLIGITMMLLSMHIVKGARYELYI